MEYPSPAQVRRLDAIARGELTADEAYDQMTAQFAGERLRAGTPPPPPQPRTGWAFVSPIGLDLDQPEVDLRVSRDGPNPWDNCLLLTLQQWDAMPIHDVLDSTLTTAGWQRIEPWADPAHSPEVGGRRPGFPYLRTRLVLT